MVGHHSSTIKSAIQQLRFIRHGDPTSFTPGDRSPALKGGPGGAEAQLGTEGSRRWEGLVVVVEQQDDMVDMVGYGWLDGFKHG